MGLPRWDSEASESEAGRTAPDRQARQTTSSPRWAEEAPAGGSSAIDRSDAEREAVLRAELPEAPAEALDGPKSKGDFDFVPRRPGQNAVQEARGRSGLLTVVVLLVLVVGAGLAYRFATDGREWSLPWSTHAEQVDGVAPERASNDSGEQADGRSEGPGSRDLSTAGVEGRSDGIGPDGRPIPIPRPRPLLESSSGSATAVAGRADQGDDSALPGDGTGRLAPLFLGRILVHYAGPGVDGISRDRAEQVVRTLEDEGYRVGNLRQVSFDIQSDSVRYFFETDRRTAERLRQDLPPGVAGNVRVLDFTTYEPRPRPGTIELWLAGPE